MFHQGWDMIGPCRHIHFGFNNNNFTFSISFHNRYSKIEGKPSAAKPIISMFLIPKEELAGRFSNYFTDFYGFYAKFCPSCF